MLTPYNLLPLPEMGMRTGGASSIINNLLIAS